MERTRFDDTDTVLTRCLDELHEIGTEVFLAKGSRVHNDLIHILIEGSCSLCLYPAGGEQKTLILFEPGMMLNFVPCLLQRQYLHSITRRRRVEREDFAIRARTDARCLTIEPDVFIERLKVSLPLNAMLVRALTENLLNMFSMASYTPTLPAALRVCRLVHELTDEERGGGRTVQMTYAELGTHLGLHSITVAKVFKRLKQAGIVVRKRGRLQVCDPGALRAVARGERELPPLHAARD